MPELTKHLSRPHAITCIVDSVYQLLDNYLKDDVTVSLDNNSCWTDCELFKFRSAVNIATGNDIIGAPVKRSRDSLKLNQAHKADTLECLHEATLNVGVQVYVEKCDDACHTAKSKAYAIAGFITSIITTNQDKILGYRIIYSGSTAQSDTDGEIDVEVISMSFEIHYLFDQTRPWVVTR